jgi:hypothetical protein
MLSLAAGLGAGSTARGPNPLQPRSSNIFEAFVCSGKTLGKQAPQAGGSGAASSGSSLGSGSQGCHAAVPLAAQRLGHQSSAGGPPSGAPESRDSAGEATSPGTAVAARPDSSRRRAQRAVVIIDSDDEDQNPAPAAPSARPSAAAAGVASRGGTADSPAAGLVLGVRKRNAHVLTSPPSHHQAEGPSTSTAQQHQSDAPRQHAAGSSMGGTSAGVAPGGSGEEKARQHTGSYFTDLLNDDIPDTAPPPPPPQPTAQQAPQAGGAKAMGSFSDFLMGKADDVRMVMAAPPGTNGAGGAAQQQQQQQAAAMLQHQQLLQQQLLQGGIQAGPGGVPIYPGRPLQVGYGREGWASLNVMWRDGEGARGGQSGIDPAGMVR